MERGVKAAFGMLALVWIASDLAGIGQALAQPAGRPGIIVALGDSLTAGYRVEPAKAYPAQLEKKLRARGFTWSVINAGMTGETSKGALMRAHAVLSLKPDIVILETGINDSRERVDPRSTRRNIEKIVRILQDKRVTVVLAGMRPLNGDAESPAFAHLYPAVAGKYGLILIPFFLEPVAGNPRLTLNDGIHPTAEGYDVITNMMLPYVEKAIEQRMTLQPMK